MPPSDRRSRPPKRISASYLERYTLYYLDRYATTSPHLRRLLRQRVDRAARHHGDDPAEGYALVDALIVRLVERGYVDDRKWARDRAAALHRKGNSVRRIRSALAAKGLRDAEVVAYALDGLTADDPDLVAARAYARRRRLGPWRVGGTDREQRRKDLAKLGRRGFSYDVARRVLDADPDEVCDDHSPW